MAVRKVEGVTVYTGMDLPHCKGIRKYVRSVVVMEADHTEPAILYIIQLKEYDPDTITTEQIKKKFINNWADDNNTDGDDVEWTGEEFNNGRIITFYYSE